MFAMGSIDVMTVAALLATRGSGSALVIVTVFVTEPEKVGMTPIVIVAVPPLRRLPRSQVTVPAMLVQAPWDGVTETKETFGGRTSRTKPLESAGPRLVTVMVYRR